MRRIFKLTPILLFLLAACGGGNSPSPEAERGRALYFEKACAGCHTVDGTRLIGPT